MKLDGEQRQDGGSHMGADDRHGAPAEDVLFPAGLPTGEILEGGAVFRQTDRSGRRRSQAAQFRRETGGLECCAVEPLFGEGDLSLGRDRDPNHQTGALPGLRFLPEIVGPSAASRLPLPAQADHHVGLPADFEVDVFEALMTAQGGTGHPPVEDVRAVEELLGRRGLCGREIGHAVGIVGRQELVPSLRQQHLLAPPQLLAAAREHLVGTAGERGDATDQNRSRVGRGGFKPQHSGKCLEDRFEMGLDRLFGGRTGGSREAVIPHKPPRTCEPHQ